jgi:hypothetical protein
VTDSQLQTIRLLIRTQTPDSNKAFNRLENPVNDFNVRISTVKKEKGGISGKKPT